MDQQVFLTINIVVSGGCHFMLCYDSFLFALVGGGGGGGGGGCCSSSVGDL